MSHRRSAGDAPSRPVTPTTRRASRRSDLGAGRGADATDPGAARREPAAEPPPLPPPLPPSGPPSTAALRERLRARREALRAREEAGARPSIILADHISGDVAPEPARREESSPFDEADAGSARRDGREEHEHDVEALALTLRRAHVRRRWLTGAAVVGGAVAVLLVARSPDRTPRLHAPQSAVSALRPPEPGPSPGLLAAEPGPTPAVSAAPATTGAPAAVGDDKPPVTAPEGVPSADDGPAAPVAEILEPLAATTAPPEPAAAGAEEPAAVATNPPQADPEPGPTPAPAVAASEPGPTAPAPTPVPLAAAPEPGPALALAPSPVPVARAPEPEPPPLAGAPAEERAVAADGPPVAEVGPTSDGEATTSGLAIASLGPPAPTAPAPGAAPPSPAASDASPGEVESASTVDDDAPALTRPAAPATARRAHANPTTGAEWYASARRLATTSPRDALYAYRRAATHGYSAAYREIGRLEAARGRNGAAISAYQRYLRANPRAADAERVRARVRSLGGR